MCGRQQDTGTDIDLEMPRLETDNTVNMLLQLDVPTGTVYSLSRSHALQKATSVLGSIGPRTVEEVRHNGPHYTIALLKVSNPVVQLSHLVPAQRDGR
jgi:hypothetical protein